MQLPLSHSQRERLAYLELKAFFVGELRRGDLEARFSIKPAAADARPQCLSRVRPRQPGLRPLRQGLHPHRAFPSAVPLFGERILSWLLHGFGDGQAPTVARTFPCEGAGELVRPDFGLLGVIARRCMAIVPCR